jgi:hypothetical protein
LDPGIVGSTVAWLCLGVDLPLILADRASENRANAEHGHAVESVRQGAEGERQRALGDLLKIASRSQPFTLINSKAQIN